MEGLRVNRGVMGLGVVILEDDIHSKQKVCITYLLLRVGVYFIRGMFCVLGSNLLAG